MNSLNFVSVLPEAIVLGAVCVILVLDAFLPDRLRHWSFWLTQITLAAAAWSIFVTAWRGLFRGETFVLALTALLGMMVMVSAANFITLYMGLELQALSLYAMVAMHRTSK